MSVVLLGYHNMGCRALKVLRDLGVDVPAVFTHKDSDSENIWFDSLAGLAKDYNIPVYYPENINDRKWVDLLKDLSPDVILSCYFRQMIKEEILSVSRIAAVNLHGSLLPKYRGRCPVNWQLVHGERVSGVTLHHMVVKPDAGDIVGQEAVQVSPRDTAITLFKRLEDAAERVLRRFIPMLLDGTAPRIPQDHSKATYFGGRRPEDGRINWKDSCANIYNLIRAVTWPYPGAFCQLKDRRLFIWEAEPLEDTCLGLKEGRVHVQDERVLVQTGKGMLRLISASFTNKTAPEAGKIPDELFKREVILR